MSRLHYAATAAHREARRRCQDAWPEQWQAVLPGGEDWPTAWAALDEQDARACVEYHLSRYQYDYARRFYAAWVAGGCCVRRVAQQVLAGRRAA